MDTDVLQQLDQKELAPLREKLHKEQGGICPILGKPFPVNLMVVDHMHMTKSDTAGVNGKGQIRGVIHFQANAWEGKITNSFIRWGLAKFGVALPDMLRNLAAYLERTPLPYIHPNEKPKPRVLGKRLYNKIKKEHLLKYPKRKPPAYPKRPVLNEKWLEFMKEFNITEE